MMFADRTGVDLGGRVPVEEAVRVAIERGLRFVDVQLDIDWNDLTLIDDGRAARLREQARQGNLSEPAS